MDGMDEMGWAEKCCIDILQLDWGKNSNVNN